MRNKLLLLLAIITLLTLVLPAAPQAAQASAPGPYFPDSSFDQVWTRTDQPVADNPGLRSWYWGPVQRSGPIYERYDGLPNNHHLVQYFDKSRMEVNFPGGDRSSKWFVTNGLLTVELISGIERDGGNTLINRGPAQVLVAGDVPGLQAPTYASLLNVSDTSSQNAHPAAGQIGADVNAIINRAGDVRQDPGRARAETRIAYYEPTTHHNIPGVFWTFLNAQGPVSVGGQTVLAPLADPWNFATGLPISEAYWAQVQIMERGLPASRWVLIQAYERRVLTYIPDYSAPWNIQMGNIGLHYLQWRYGGHVPDQAAVYDVTAHGGQICRATVATRCDPADASSDPVTMAYNRDTAKVDSTPGSSLGLQTVSARYRLVEGTTAQFRLDEELNLLERAQLFLSQGSVGVNHNGAGEVTVDAGSTGILLLDTKVSVERRADGRVKVGVFSGERGVVVSRLDGTRPRTIRAGQQVEAAADGTLGPTERLDADTLRFWAIYGNGEDLQLNPAAFDPAACRFKNELYLGPPDARLGCPMAQAQHYTPDAPGPVGFFRGGTLLYDVKSQPPTMYTVYSGSTITPPQGTANTWDSFSWSGRSLGSFLQAHPDVAARLGAALDVACTAPVWALQRWAGGTTLTPPDPNVQGCAQPSASTLLLYEDGTWAVWPPPAPPPTLTPLPVATVTPVPPPPLDVDRIPQAAPSTAIYYPGNCLPPSTDPVVTGGVTSQAGLAQVILGYWYNPTGGSRGPVHQLPMTEYAQDQYKATIPLNGAADEMAGNSGFIEYYMEATDKLGNTGTSARLEISLGAGSCIR